MRGTMDSNFLADGTLWNITVCSLTKSLDELTNIQGLKMQNQEENGS